MTSNICYDHLGNEFPSESSMLNHYGINYSGFHYRMNKLGWSLEDALTKPHKDRLSTAIECTDHEGNTFESKVAMCDYWHIPRTTFFRRLRDGWSLEKALTETVKHTNNMVQPVIDPNGKKFTTIDNMCDYWNISKKQYMINIRNNCSLKEALTLKTQPKKYPEDHLGNKYTSINDMCRTYNITKTTLRCRIELGWSLKEILTNPNKKNPGKMVTDHEGNVYATQKDMLEHYNISSTTYKNRLNMGLSQKDALLSKNLQLCACKDHLGNHFETLQDMLSFWNVNPSTYHARKDKLKWPTEKILTTISRGKYDTFSKNLIILKDFKNGYFEVKLKEHHCILSLNEILTIYRKEKGLI